MSTAARVAACLLTIAPRARRLRAPLPVGVPAATPLAVKHEKDRPDSAERASPVAMRDLGATPTSGKENSDAFHRLATLQVGKDSSPNTLAAEATAIAGITALTQVSITPSCASVRRTCRFESPVCRCVTSAPFNRGWPAGWTVTGEGVKKKVRSTAATAIRPRSDARTPSAPRRKSAPRGH
jgi:hypothetical protein